MLNIFRRKRAATATAKSSPMKYKMLALDLDGTLFDSSGKVPDIHRKAVDQARDAGVMIVLSTGRGLAESQGAVAAIGHRGPIVLAGGALVSDPLTGKTLHRSVIDPTLARQLSDHMAAAGHAVLILLDPEPQDHDYLVSKSVRLTPNTKWWFDVIKADVRYVDDPTEKDLHHVLRVGILAAPAEMEALQASLIATFGSRIEVQNFMAVKQKNEELHVLEAFAAGVTKWSGLTWLAAEHGIGLHEIAAIGDHINDVSMIKNAACGVAMGNAVDQVLKVAKHITHTNDHGGVAYAINQMLAGKW